MSIKLMDKVFDRYPVGGGEMILALKLADHAHDDGTHIFPGIPLLMEKTRLPERTVQRYLQNMQRRGWLIKVFSSKGGKGNATEYQISSDWINGAKLAPVATVPNETLTVPTKVCTGAKLNIAYKEEPSENHHRTVIRAREKISNDNESQVVTIAWDASQKIFTNISPEQFKLWEQAFPKLDIDNTLTRIELWYHDNPKKHKRNILRFITGWMSRDFAKLIHPKIFLRAPPRPVPGIPP